MSKIPNQTSTQRLKPTPSKTTFSTDSKKCRSLPSCLALITCMHRYKSEPNLIIWLEPVVRRFVRGYHYPLPENAIPGTFQSQSYWSTKARCERWDIRNARSRNYTVTVCADESLRLLTASKVVITRSVMSADVACFHDSTALRHAPLVYCHGRRSIRFLRGAFRVQH